MSNILIVDNEIGICMLLRKILRKQGFTVDTALSGSTGLRMLKETAYDIIFCDYQLKDKELNGGMLMNSIHKLHPHTAVVIMSAYPNVRVAIRMIKEGAYDYLLKPFSVAAVLALTGKIINDTRYPLKHERPLSLNHNDQYVYGESPVSKELYHQIAMVAPTNYSIIILGETGTGKEAVARLIHLQSKRAHQPFIALDCGSLSDELASSELFGHERGAFTGAATERKGAFELAQGGTLFLDEITNLSYSIQTALLRVIQERVVRKVGSLKEIPVDIRLLAASNENPAVAVARGAFRLDLFYRLNEFSVSVPSLRSRLEDLPLFIATFMRDTAITLGKETGHFSAQSLACLRNYSWPGNIRELKNVIRKACLLTTDVPECDITSLPEEIINAYNPVTMAPHRSPATRNHLKIKAGKTTLPKIMVTKKPAGNNKTKAAGALHLDRKTLCDKLQLPDTLS